MVVAEVQAAGGTHAREDALVLTGDGTQKRRLPRPASSVIAWVVRYCT